MHTVTRIISRLVVLLCAIFFISACREPKYMGPIEDVRLYQAMDAYGERVAKDQGMQLMVVGDVTDDHHIAYCLYLRSFGKNTLDEGRVLAANLVDDFWSYLKRDPTVRAYIDWYVYDYSRLSSYKPSPEVLLEKVGFKIAYWNTDVNRPPEPYLAEIMFAEKQFHYYEADPQTQALRLVYKESYEDALAYRDASKEGIYDQ